MLNQKQKQFKHRYYILSKALEEKQKKYGAASAKTREDMTRMMKTEAMFLLERIQENDNLLQKIYLNRPFAETSEASLSKKKMMSRLDPTTPKEGSSLLSGLSKVVNLRFMQ